MNIAIDGTRTAGSSGGGGADAFRRFLRSQRFARGASYVFLLFLWWLASVYEDRFPAPLETFQFLWIEVTGGSHGGIVRGEFIEHFAATLPRFGLGIAISLVLGIAVGVLIGGSKLAEALFKDTLLVLVALPAIIWAFLTQMWFGLGDDAVVITTFLSAFPFVSVNVVQGIQAIPRELRRMSGAFHVPGMKRLRHMQIPAITGYIFAGFRFAVIIGWNAVLLAEWFSSSEGVGWRSRYWYDANRYRGFVAWVVLFIGFIVALDRLVLVRLQRRAFRWRDAQLSTIEREAEEIDVGVKGA
ncbi:MAG TPA: ABC transporter permease subunit [Actinomycetota bacterium]|nr:ABC transporter permease subunit [Actinomycetota bacterium]